MTPPRRSRPVLVVAVVAVVVAGCLAFAWQRTDPARGAARNYLKALAAGDGELACTLMTRSFGAEMAARWSARGCPDGIDAMLAGLSGGQRRRLGDTPLADLRTEGSSGSVGVDANPLNITRLRLAKVDEEWMVAGDR